MQTPTKYREFAEECDRLAKRAKTNGTEWFKEMAEAWRKLSEEADRTEPC
jgi:hypothetical protein